jgi:transglutaminase-like putative cysteine protease
MQGGLDPATWGNIMRFSIGCDLAYDVVERTTFILNIAALREGRQKILAERLSLPQGQASEEKIAPETSNRYLRLVADPGELTVRYEAQVLLEPDYHDPETIDEVPVAELPLELMGYLNPSRYCLSDELARFAQRQFGAIEPGFNRVTEICNWIHAEVDYVSGASDSLTTAADTFAMRAGVCRDFAHLGITFCRALGIPARFVSAYAWQLEPQDFHAVFEVWLGDRWYLFDATRMAALDGLIRIGCGRDAADSAFCNIFGNARSDRMEVWCHALDGNEAEPWTTEAVSLSSV